MKLKIEIDCDNAAFEDDPGQECYRILQGPAAINGVRHGTGAVLYDINGNKVGAVRWVES